MKNQKYKIGLALGSGGARGLAHIGVIKALVKNNIEISYITGSSAGALIGGLYAATGDINKVEELVSEINFKKFVTIFSDIFKKKGVFAGNRAEKYLDKLLNGIDISQTKIPFKVATTDIIEGRTIILQQGNLAKVIRASTSIPFVFKPVEIEGKFLVDGAVSTPIPVEAVKKMGADKTIAVNLYYYPAEKRARDLKEASAFLVGRSSLQLLLYNLAKYNEKEADIVINPQIPYLSMVTFMHGKKYVKKGEEAVERKMEEIRKMVGA